MILETVLYSVGSSVLTYLTLTGTQYYLKCKNTKKPIPVPVLPTTPVLPEVLEGTEVIPFGLVVSEPETREQKIKRLRKIHPNAYHEYTQGLHRNSVVLDLEDGIVRAAIQDVHNGIQTIEFDSYHMTFSGGLRIWTSNLYFGFGNIHNATGEFARYRFETGEGKIHLETWLELVDMHYRNRSPAVWRQKHANYDREL